MNLIGHFRSNYFAVKERAAFEEWCRRLGLHLIVNEHDPHLVGFLNADNEAGIPSIVVEEKDGKEEEVDIDFIGELATFLQDGHVAIVIEIFYEGYRYLGGVAYALNNKNEQMRIDLDDILTTAGSLGQYVTKCEY